MAGLAWLTCRHRASCSPLVVDTTIGPTAPHGPDAVPLIFWHKALDWAGTIDYLMGVEINSFS